MISKRKKVNIKEWLQWVMGFIKTDLQSFSEERREQLIEKLVFFSSTEFPRVSPLYKDFDYYKDHYFPPPGKRNIKLKVRFASAASQISKIQDVLRSMLEDLQNIILNKSQKKRKKYELCESMVVLSMDSFFIGDEDKFQVRFRPKNDTDLVALAKLHLAELLGGLPVHAITKCKGCSTYFLNLTEKKKIYCTSSCASRSIHKAERERLKKENPVKSREYLDKQRGYYWKKKKAEYPNVKIPLIKRRVL